VLAAKFISGECVVNKRYPYSMIDLQFLMKRLL